VIGAPLPQKKSLTGTDDIWNPHVGLYMRPGESITAAWLRWVALEREWFNMRYGPDR
jgi:hypothetical protein